MRKCENMKVDTLQKKIQILERGAAFGAGIYYNINLTKNLVPGKIYQVSGQKPYCINDSAGLPENASFSDITAYWGRKLSGEEKTAYEEFFDVSHMLEQFRNGKRHFIYSYWTETVLSKPLLAEQHIILYEDEENGDVLGISFFRNLTEQAEKTEELRTERLFLEVICKDYTTVHYAELKNDIAEPLKMELSANASQIARIQLRKKIGYTESVTNYCENYVAENGKKDFLRVMQREQLLKELSKTGRFVYRYESIPNKAGHRYFEVQVVRINEEHFDGNVIVAFRHIDDIITREQKYQWELEKTAYTDALTGIGNRTAFTKEIREFEHNVHAACVVADVNNLKVCNDRYGHHEGDNVIRDAAECIGKAFETSGVCYRIGGDEFCVLIRNGEKTQILDAIEQLEEFVKEKNKHRVMPMSIACGYALREDENESMEHLFNRSDEMMYDAKYRMKNEFPVYCEERIKNYLNVLNILSKSPDSYLYLWDIARDENWFFGDVSRDYALRDKGKPTNEMSEMEAIIYPADRKMLHDDLKLIAEGKKQIHDMNYRWVNRNGEAVWINCRGKVINDDRGNPFVMIGRVSDKVLRYLYHPLTKLFNKNKLLMDLSESILAKDSGYLMLVGIDNLGSINLKHGRSYGDNVIRQCAGILEKNVSLQNIWHVENNCFALYIDVTSEEEVRAVYHKLLAELSGICTISAGVGKNSRKMFGDETNLYACAEMTFEKAKGSGMRTIAFFSQEDLEKRIKTIRFLDEMQESVKNGCKGFYLCYQPQIKTGNYHLYGAEALLRYHSDTQGEVYPDEFIPLLEQSKLIRQVGLWVLETALMQCREWRKSMKDFHVSVNFSTVQLEEKDVGEKVLDILAKSGLPGEALTIELTESTQLQEAGYLSNIFQRWRETGIGLSIDDFGTGYASMSYLKELNVEEIKIDRLFVKGIEEATYNYRLISNMIEFAKTNAIRICCEGVEDVHELTVLEGLAPNLIQGYLFSKPCKTEEFESAFINQGTEAYRRYDEFVRKIYQYKDKMHVVYFDAKNILRETELGLWIIRINEREQYYEMHADETMEHIMSVDRKYTPQECYAFWHNRIVENYRDYVNKNVKRMMETDKVVELEYAWMHPELGEIRVRCSGRRVEDTDGMVTLEGYHRTVSNIERAL